MTIADDASEIARGRFYLFIRAGYMYGYQLDVALDREAGGPCDGNCRVIGPVVTHQDQIHAASFPRAAYGRHRTEDTHPMTEAVGNHVYADYVAVLLGAVRLPAW